MHRWLRSHIEGYTGVMYRNNHMKWLDAGKQLSEPSPNTGRPADIELICWLRSFHLNAEEVVLAGTHRAIVKPPLGTVIHQEKSVYWVAPPPTSSPLWSVQTFQQTSRKKNSQHIPCLLTLWWNNATVSFVNRIVSYYLWPDFRFEENWFGLKWNNKPGRCRFYRGLDDEAVGPQRAFHRWFPNFRETMWKQEYDVHFDLLLQLL